MNEQQRAELERIRDVLYPATGLEDYDEEIIGRVLKDIKALLAQSVPVKCWCHKCNEHNTVNGLPFSMTQMILCPECGNKRCPKASDHQLDCTGSNEAGQHGSVYTAPQPVPVQEPVAVVSGYYGGQCVVLPTNPARLFNSGTAFYTAPQPVPVKTYHDGKPWPVAPKPWVGLSRDEVLDIEETTTHPLAFYQAIEAKLKEKNT
jgi:hypothetical protein